MYVLQELLKIWRKIASKFLLVYTGCSQKGGSVQHPLNPLFFGLFPMFGAYFDHSFWYFLATLLKKSWKTSSSKKGYISGLAQIGSFSADWNLGVADFEFNYLGHFFSIWNFFLPIKTKKIKIQKIAKLSQPWNITFSEDAIFQLGGEW